MATIKPPASAAQGSPGGGGRDRDHDNPSPGDPVLQVRLVTDDVAAFKKLVETTPLSFACAMPRLSPKGVVSAHVLMTRRLVEQIERENKSVKVEVVADPSDFSGDRRPEVGKGNRYAERGVLPQGRGKLIPRGTPQ
jgi:hypothetical protein